MNSTEYGDMLPEELFSAAWLSASKFSDAGQRMRAFEEVMRLGGREVRAVEDFKVVDAENRGLRAILSFLIPHVRAAPIRRELLRTLALPIDDGGILRDYVTDMERDVDDMATLMERVVKHVEPLMEDGAPDPSGSWYIRMDGLLSRMREYERVRQRDTLDKTLREAGV